MSDNFEQTHPAPIPVVEERTPSQRIDLIVKDLQQLAKEFDGTPIATACVDAMVVLEDGKVQHAATDAA